MTVRDRVFQDPNHNDFQAKGSSNNKGEATTQAGNILNSAQSLGLEANGGWVGGRALVIQGAQLLVSW